MSVVTVTMAVMSECCCKVVEESCFVCVVSRYLYAIRYHGVIVYDYGFMG
jgi:hypothetical protein